MPCNNNNNNNNNSNNNSNIKYKYNAGQIPDPENPVQTLAITAIMSVVDQKFYLNHKSKLSHNTQ